MSSSGFQEAFYSLCDVAVAAQAALRAMQAVMNLPLPDPWLDQVHATLYNEASILTEILNSAEQILKV